MSNLALNGQRGWRTWLKSPVTTDHTALVPAVFTGLTPGAIVGDQSIGVGEFRAIALRMFGKDTLGDTATMAIVGWMDDQVESGSGPGQIIWNGKLTLGAPTLAMIPLSDNRWGASAIWFEVGTYDSTVGHNAAKAISLTGDGQATLLLPTLGYRHLQMTVTDIGGGGTEMTSLNGLWRGISEGDVI